VKNKAHWIMSQLPEEEVYAGVRQGGAESRASRLDFLLIKKPDCGGFRLLMSHLDRPSVDWGIQGKIDTMGWEDKRQREREREREGWDGRKSQEASFSPSARF
jgi:hypothetical protein